MLDDLDEERISPGLTGLGWSTCQAFFILLSLRQIVYTRVVQVRSVHMNLRNFSHPTTSSSHLPYRCDRYRIHPHYTSPRYATPILPRSHKHTRASNQQRTSNLGQTTRPSLIHHPQPPQHAHNIHPNSYHTKTPSRPSISSVRLIQPTSSHSTNAMIHTHPSSPPFPIPPLA